MFTGIIEQLAKVIEITKEKNNLLLTFQTPLAGKLKINQSIAHNGVCLSVAGVKRNHYLVTAIEETLNKTNLSTLKKNDLVNIERAMSVNSLLNGHIVQGHVDGTAICRSITNKKGSWVFEFQLEKGIKNLVIEKGSIAVNGVSLTVAEVKKSRISVALIPYTYHHTNFSSICLESIVNIEFDVIGKYVKQFMVNKRN